MPRAFATKKNLRPALMALSGVILIAAAWPAAKMLPPECAKWIYAIDVILWLAAVGWCVARAIRSSASAKTIGRYLLVAGVFTLGTFPYNVADFAMLTTHLLSLAGVALLIAGLFSWPSVHVYFSQFYRLLCRSDTIPSDLFVWVLYVAFLIVAASLSWHCFSFLPANWDTIAQNVHAKFIAQGHLYGKSHPLHEFFKISMMIDDGKWYSQYQPLHIFMLAAGYLGHSPWLVNPTEGALTLMVIYSLTRRICDEPTARLAALLTLGCQMVLFMSSEYMSHATALLFTTLFIYFYIETLETHHRWRALCAGLCLGGVFLTRPLTSVEIGLPFIIYSFYLLGKDGGIYLKPFLMMAVGGLACLAFQGWYNVQTTGDMLLFPYIKAWVGHYPGFGNGYTLWSAIIKAQHEWTKMNIVLFEWPVPSTFFFLLACLLPFQNRYLYLLLAVVISTLLVDMTNHLEEYNFGPRYIYESSSALIILIAAGIRKLPLLLRSWSLPLPEESALRGMIALLLILFFMVSLAERFPSNISMYVHEWKSSHPEFESSLAAQSQKPALIFIDKLYWWVAHNNPPDDTAAIIYASDLGGLKNRQLMEYYPHRNAYLERNGQLYTIDKITFQSSAPTQNP